MRRKVLIAGAGQLGSRYLQGLSKLNEPLDIFVFDPSPGSLARSEQRWAEIQPEAAHEVRYVSSLYVLPASIDLAIIATTADVRVNIVQQINGLSEIRYWILEKVLAQSKEDLLRLERTLGGGKKVWVNTPRYQWELYRELRGLYRDRGAIDACFMGFDGLACNAIHYVDFVSRWRGERLVSIDTGNLLPIWQEGKRSGFYEVEGQLALNFSGGSALRLVSGRDIPAYTVTLKIDHDEWVVNEAQGVATAVDGRIVKGSVAFQSQLTAPIVQAIWSDAPCELPSLAESIEQHKVLLDALNAHWNSYMPNKVSRLPIT